MEFSMVGNIKMNSKKNQGRIGNLNPLLVVHFRNLFARLE
jgi:hypothetical protein